MSERRSPRTQPSSEALGALVMATFELVHAVRTLAWTAIDVSATPALCHFECYVPLLHPAAIFFLMPLKFSLPVSSTSLESHPSFSIALLFHHEAQRRKPCYRGTEALRL